MKSGRGWFVGLPLKMKLLFMWVPVLGIFLLCFFLFMSVAQLNMYENTLDANRQNLKSLREALNDATAGVEESVHSLSLSTVLLEYVDGAGRNDPQLLQQMSTILFNSVITSRFITSLGIIRSENDWLMRNPYAFSVKQEELSHLYRIAQMQSEDVFIGATFSNGQKRSVYLYPLRTDAGELKGCIFAVLDHDMLEKMLANYSDGVNHYYVFNSSGSFIFGNDYSAHEALKDILFAVPDENGLLKLSRTYYLRDTLPSLNWIILTEATSIMPYRNLKTVGQFTVVMSVFLCILTLIVYFLINRQFTDRIDELNGFAQRIIGGDLANRFQARYTDEISRLGNQLNRMADTLQVQTAKITAQEFRIQNTQLLALQNQMNPHFIYNTLESIRMVAIVNREREIADMTMQLASLIRYTSKASNGYATVREEIEHMNAYLKLQSCKLQERLAIRLDIDPGIMRETTLRFFLQPLVENAIIHGIEPKRGASTLWVCGESCEDGIRFVIRDDGVGIPPEKLAELREMLAGQELREEDVSIKSKGIGLINVNERCRLLFGSNDAIRIESVPGEGTTLTIVIPKGCEGHEDRNH